MLTRRPRQNRYWLLVATMTLAACSTNPNKAQQLDTKVDNQKSVTGDTSVGVKNGDMIVQRKVLMSEELRTLQYEVYSLEDHVYGNRKYGSSGLYGVLKDCRIQLSDKNNGGDGKLMWTEPIDRVTDKEDDFKLGLDEKSQLVGISEEFLKDRIERFRNYKMILQKRQDEYDDKVAICQNELKSRRFDSEKSGK